MQFTVTREKQCSKNICIQNVIITVSKLVGNVVNEKHSNIRNVLA